MVQGKKDKRNEETSRTKEESPTKKNSTTSNLDRTGKRKSKEQKKVGAHKSSTCTDACEEAGDEMIECSLCGEWKHFKCAELNNNHMDGFWACAECKSKWKNFGTATNEGRSRELEKKVIGLTREMAERGKILQEALQNINDSLRELSTRIGDLGKGTRQDERAVDSTKNTKASKQDEEKEAIVKENGEVNHKSLTMDQESDHLKIGKNELRSYGTVSGTVEWDPNFLEEEPAKKLEEKIIEECNNDITEFEGIPRKIGWWGSEEYRYGLIVHGKNNKWPQSLLELKKEVEAKVGSKFNAAMINIYRNGKDSVGWHSDDESQRSGKIASVSLGETRTFELRRKGGKEKAAKVELARGALLTMDNRSQRYWEHRVPKESGKSGRRVNITFRHIESKEEEEKERKCMVVGDKVIKKIDRWIVNSQKERKNTELVALPGASIPEIASIAKELVRIEGKTKDMIVQLSQESFINKDMETSAKELWGLVNDLRTEDRAGLRVAIGEVLTNKRPFSEERRKVEEVNSMLEFMCKENQIMFFKNNLCKGGRGIRDQIENWKEEKNEVLGGVMRNRKTEGREGTKDDPRQRKEAKRKKRGNKVKTRDLKIVYVNINGLGQGKVNNVTTLLKNGHNGKVDIVCASETKRQFSTEDQQTQIEGFHWWPLNRLEGAGGGMSLWVREGKGIEINKEIVIPETLKGEVVWVNTRKPKEIVIGFLYMGVDKKKNENRNEELWEHLNGVALKLKEGGKTVVLLGDFNAHVKREEETWIGQNRNGNRLIQLIEIGNLKMLNNSANCEGKWTYFGLQRKGVKSVIDYGLVTDKDFNKCNMVIDELDDLGMESDHSSLIVQIKQKGINNDPGERSRKTNYLRKEKWNLGGTKDWEGFRNKVARTLTDRQGRERNGTEIDTEYNNIVEALIDAGNTVIGKGIRRKGKRKVPWWDEELKEKLKTKKRKNKIWRKSVVEEAELEISKTWRELTKEKKEWKNLIGKKKGMFKSKQLEEILQDKSGNKKFWDHIKNLEDKGNSTVESIRDKDGTIVEREEEVQERLEKFWRELYETEEIDKGDQEQREIVNNGEERIMKEIEMKELKESLSKLKNRKASGRDNIPNEFLKEGGEVVHEAIKELFNKIIKKKEIPDGWRTSTVKTLYKGSGDKRDLNNYRGICLGSNIEKLFTRLMKARLEKLVEKDNILGEIQNGFRKGRGTTDNLFMLTNILEGRSKLGRKTVTCFIDFKKAYDKIWREGLWKTLEELGLGGGLVELLKSLYKDNKVEVEWNGRRVKDVEVKTGLRQGCNLSPILFALFIQRLGKKLLESKKGITIGKTHIPALFFADDLVIMARSKEDLQILLDIVHIFCEEWKMEVNIEKTKILQEGEERESGLKIGSKEIKSTQAYKYLGIWISAKSKKWWEKWESNFEVLAKRLGGRIKGIANRSCDKLKVGRMLWENVAMPTLGYGVEIVPISTKVETRWRATQRDIAKWILGGGWRTPGVALRGDLGWEEPKEWSIYRKMKYAARYYMMHESRWPGAVFSWLLSNGIATKWWETVETNSQKYARAGGGPGWGNEKEAFRKIHKAFKIIEFNKWKDEVGEKPYLSNYLRKIKPEKEWVVETDFRGRELITKARTGSLEVNVNMSKWGLRGNTECEICSSGADETLEHMLRRCPAFRRERVEWERSVDNLGGANTQIGNTENNNHLELGFSGKHKEKIGKVTAAFLSKIWEKRGQILRGNRE